jgi:hypothetical protein
MEHQKNNGQNLIHMPSPTAWPITFALGLTLMTTGLVTSAAVSLVGLILFLLAAVGWFFDVLPVEKHFFIEVPEESIERTTARAHVDSQPIDAMHRKIIPVESFQITTGLRGSRSSLQPSPIPQPLVCDESARSGRICELGQSE